MKIIGYTALHYGKDYLGYAIRSIIDQLDEYHVFYTAIGSHGHRTLIPCPETRDELYAIAKEAAGDKLIWHDGTWPFEGAQRDEVLKLVAPGDIVVTLDYDEIWPEGLLEACVGQIIVNKWRVLRVPMIHYWRSFYRAVLDDQSYPERLQLIGGNGEGTGKREYGYINHMGYAIRPSLMRYKWLVHGHYNELRKDCNWHDDVYNANRQTDCHPTNINYWNPIEIKSFIVYTTRQMMPSYITEHPFNGVGVIEDNS